MDASLGTEGGTGSRNRSIAPAAEHVVGVAVRTGSGCVH